MEDEPKELKSTEMSPTVMKLVPSRPGSISPALTYFSGALMELDEYRPSIADQVRVGFFSQDRSSQTDVSEIAQLKEMTEVLQTLVRDIENLKRSLHYAKHVLQADYENKLQERALDLYCRVNDRILELEKQHEARVDVIRRSYRQQLGDAITQIASQHQKYYAKKSKQDKVMFSEKLKKVEDDDALKKKAQQQQDGIIEMMKMQMRDAQERADRQLEDALNRPKSASSVATNPEIYELREEVEKLENKLDDMMNQLEDRENENSRLVTDIDDLNEQLNGERLQVQQLKKELSDALLAAEHEKNNFRNEHKLSSDQVSSNKGNEVKTVDQTTMFFLLQRQKAQLQREMDTKIEETKSNLMAASRKQVEELQRAHDQKIKEQMIIDEKRRLMESQQTKEKPQLSDSEKDERLKKLQKLEKKQKAEILRLQKELERVNKTWEMKVTILQQTLHALKDESFLRTTLQRQAARLQQAAVVYASDGPAVITSNRKGFQGSTYRTLQRPGGMKQTIPYEKADRIVAESPFSEDRPTPAPSAEGEPPLTNMNAKLGIGGIISREKNERSSSLLESSTSAKPAVDAV